MGEIVQVTDHAARAVARLIQQFKDKPKIVALVTALVGEIQTLEDAMYQCLTNVATGIENAAGYQLDIIGKILGQSRDSSSSDSEYRIRLRARLRANLSSGTPEDVIGVFWALMAGTGNILYKDSGLAGFVIQIGDYPLTDVLVRVFAEFLRDAKSGGVQAVLEYQVGEDVDTWYFDTAFFKFPGFGDWAPPLLDVVVSGQDTFAFDALPATGQLMLAAGTATEETFDYVKGTTGFFITPATFVHVHPETDPITILDTIGEGMGDHATPATGGDLAGAVGA